MIKTITFASLLLWSVGCNQKENQNDSKGPIARTVGVSQNTLSVIYNSFDGGRSWVPFDDGIPKEATVSSFAIVDDKIFASMDYHGIYLIKEGEKQWKRVDEDLPEKVDINAIAAIGNSLIIGTLRDGIMISENNGKNWRYPTGRINNNSPVRIYSLDDLT